LIGPGRWLTRGPTCPTVGNDVEDKGWWAGLGAQREEAGRGRQVGPQIFPFSRIYTPGKVNNFDRGK
jgi:hypothetical protein